MTHAPTTEREPRAGAVGDPADLGLVAIVHDYLNQRGGAERVVLEMGRIWGGRAPIYTSLYRPESTFPEFAELEVRASALDVVPVDSGFRNLFPLYPAAFRLFGTLEEDIIVSSSSGWAHGIRTSPTAFHAVYCHTPARWLYGGHHLGDSGRQRALRAVLPLVRTWDRSSARRADLYIANSNEVRRRIGRQYGIDAPVVYPPVDVDRFRATPRGERLLVVSRLLPYKRIELVVDAATRAGIGLDVVGVGPALNDLRARAGKTVEFHGRLPDEDVTGLIEGCRALCLPGHEDFGMTPVEANAAGKPVVAYAAGGALETIEEGRTGAFFDRYETTDLLDAIARCDAIDTAPEDIAASAERFSGRAFRAGLVTALASGVRAHRERLGLD